MIIEDNQQLLEGFTIIDLSSRLPGPLAGHILSSLGAEVIKIEDENFKDPFKDGLYSDQDPSFSQWYKELNHNKKIQTYNYSLDEDIMKIRSLIAKADACLNALPPKIAKKLGLNDHDQKAFPDLKVIINVSASRDNSMALHDLNVLAKVGILELYLAQNNQDIIAPPFLPMGGITFGQQLALELSTALLKSIQTKQVIVKTSYLEDACTRVLSPFWGESLRKTHKTKFLHNGLYPCYNIYRTQDDHFVIMAALEEKFWNRFCQIFELPLEGDLRFETASDKVFETLVNLFKGKKASDIKKLINEENLCINVIE